MDNTPTSARDQNVGDMMKSALCAWGRSHPRRLLFFLGIAWRMWWARRRRRRAKQQVGGPVPSIVGISPTMRCNYHCKGCYSRGRPVDDELTTAELHALLAEAEALGVSAIVVTGGEPFMRPDLIDLMAAHRRLLFVPITNGSLITPHAARRIAASGNVMPLGSIEGFAHDTDRRRQPGAHEAVLRAFGHFRQAGACFGFSAVNTQANCQHLGSDAFVDEMIERGCAVGYYTEYVPCGPDPHPDWVPDATTRAAFRQRVLDQRRTKPIVLIQLPHDEYGAANRCSAAGQESLHINPQGAVEPCPFMPVARDNIRDGGLRAACQSPFLRAIREHPLLLQRQRYACALFEHQAELHDIAPTLGAHPSG